LDGPRPPQLPSRFAVLKYSPLRSIGVDWPHGALPEKDFHGRYGYKIMQPNSPILEGTGLNFNDTLSCKSVEYDGTLFTGLNEAGDPVLDTVSLGFCKIELIGYDWGSSVSDPSKKGYGTFLAFKKSPTSGNVINTAFDNWCSGVQVSGVSGGFGGRDSVKIKRITLNMFNLLLNRENIFSSAVNDDCHYTTKCEGKNEDHQFEVFPNPSNGRFTLQSLEFQIMSVDIYSSSATKLYSIIPEKQQFSMEVELPPSPFGSYVIHITTECGTTMEKLIVTNKR